MNIMQIVKISLSPDAKNKLSSSLYGDVEKWLNEWIPQANFQAVISESKEDSLELCRISLKEKLIPYWFEKDLSLEYFNFQVSEQEVVNNKFWMSSLIVCSKKYNIN